jgi:hypothetical protein
MSTTLSNLNPIATWRHAKRGLLRERFYAQEQRKR